MALPIGLLVGHTGRGSLLAAMLSNVWRALPTLGLVILVFRIEPLSIWPVLVALVVIAVPPILLNTDVAIRSIDPGVRDAARGMGMTGTQALWRVEVPIATPLILAGFRSAAGQVVATATIAAFVGLGGLGRYIIDGYAARDIGQITGGAIVVAVLALVVEGVFALLQRTLAPDRTATAGMVLPPGHRPGRLTGAIAVATRDGGVSPEPGRSR
ncbi:MAG: ABC transporter, permease protein (cluster 13, osmolytes) [uncultured Thermoleophilia bacterium]|uniref:ABC transporter, permease protein (Cluster 13, osmolytes) n=1 Tax=uncultured Thermoleophilia bacterium TaxID=1497501 RepID=A0A6J4TLC0_9ACTN|nr:MAG: ABC transporter, permease protein (cluster 13, osmolytes) [uncultured Thermoleophilia bacterium]